MEKQADLMKMTKAFARNVRDCRKALGLTQEELAEASGLSANYIARLEIGTSTPSFAALITLSTSLRVPASDLLATEYEAPTPSDISTTIATVLDALTNEETEYVVSQLRNSVRFVVAHRRDTSD